MTDHIDHDPVFTLIADVEVVAGADVANVEVRHDPMDHVGADGTCDRNG